MKANREASAKALAAARRIEREAERRNEREAERRNERERKEKA